MVFQPGDVVRVREWDEMAAEHPIDSDGDIKFPNNFYFVQSQKKWCGTEHVVAAIATDPDELFFENEPEGFLDWAWTPSFFELVEDTHLCDEYDEQVLTAILTGK